MFLKKLLLIIGCFPFVLAAQKKKEIYHFVEYHLVNDSSTKISSGGYGFSYVRYLNKDSSFRESGLFSRDTSHPYNTNYVFKRKGNCWLIKLHSTWYPFFNKGKSVNSVIKINGYNFKIHWEQTQLSDKGLPIFLLKFKPINFSVSGLSKYYFTFKDGVIAIDGHESFLVRSDKKNLNFNKD